VGHRLASNWTTETRAADWTREGQKFYNRRTLKSVAKAASQLDHRGTKILQSKNSEKCSQRLVPESVAVFFFTAKKISQGLADFGNPSNFQ